MRNSNSKREDSTKQVGKQRARKAKLVRRSSGGLEHASTEIGGQK